MSQSISQPWRLSQTANKSNGVCSVCHATRQLHLKDGTVHRHGPRDKPCPGSDKLPLGPSGGHGAPQSSQPSAGVIVSSSNSVRTDDIPILPPDPSPAADSSWKPLNHGVIKHIPKSARAACASHFASLLRSVTLQPETASNWYTLFQWWVWFW